MDSSLYQSGRLDWGSGKISTNSSLQETSLGLVMSPAKKKRSWRLSHSAEWSKSDATPFFSDKGRADPYETHLPSPRREKSDFEVKRKHAPKKKLLNPTGYIYLGGGSKGR